jgi:hypothetical protein
VSDNEQFRTRVELCRYVDTPYRNMTKGLREALMEDGIVAEDMPDPEMARLWDDAEEGLGMMEDALSKIAKILEAGS